MKRWMWGVGILACVIAGSILVFRFPWDRTLDALEEVNVGLLATALLINLASPFAKGWAWHLLLGTVSRNRFWIAQEANLVGTAVNSIAAGVSGEAARITLIRRRDGVPIRAAVLSIVWSRGVEALGLTLFVVLAPTVLELPPPLRGLQIGAAVALATVFLVAQFRGWNDLIERLPEALRTGARDFAAMSRGPRLIAPTALALVSWAAEWATYHLTLHAVHIPVGYAASFTALIAVNVGGLIRITPGNVGVLQAAMVGALLPFGVEADQAVAAGFALQAIEVLPVLAIAVVVAGRAGLANLMAGAELREPG
ncbi:MAG TPA: lysylphosphatidylglycerol synthase transmembrane domain-containing protein [Gemmatimonadales bacterium]|nr:lysylphosphatidylglycerol synthase transmembrane domain-containing protein [Gemmatimonadales bacterium]